MKKIMVPGKDKVVSTIDPRKLHSFVLKNVSQELGNLVEDCYYPKFSTIYKELLHLTNSTEKNLVLYSKKKYGNPKFHLLHDPKTTLLILIIQEFLDANDVTAALSVYHLLSLRTYSNVMHKFIKYCNPDHFRMALSKLSHNHLFVSKKTIGTSIMYLSNTMFKKHKDSLVNDDPENIQKMIMEIRHRFNQSIRSFAQKYYESHKAGLKSKSEDEKEYDPGLERNIRDIVSKITGNITTYKNIDKKAIDEAQKLTKFNRKLSAAYVSALSTTKYSGDIGTALYLLLRDIKDFDQIDTVKFLDYVKRLMSIKVSKQPMYFKKTISGIHSEILKDLELEDWHSKLSIQSKAISRNFIAYYLAFYVRNYIS